MDGNDNNYKLFANLLINLRCNPHFIQFLQNEKRLFLIRKIEIFLILETEPIDNATRTMIKNDIGIFIKSVKSNYDVIDCFINKLQEYGI